MRQFPAMIGCASMVAIVGFGIALAASLFASEAGFWERVLGATAVGSMPFVAALLLCFQDLKKQRTAMRSVKRRLLARHDMSELDFLSRCNPEMDTNLLLQLRRAVAAYFVVTPEKIYSTDRLQEDYAFEILQLSMHAFVISHVCADRKTILGQYAFHTSGLIAFNDLARETQRVLGSVKEDAARGL